MKKICLLLLMLALMFIMPVAAFAASSETYRLDDLGMSIDIPSEYLVITRDIAGGDSNLSADGSDKGDLLDFYETNNIYLDVWDPDMRFEIIVTAEETEHIDFHLISDAALKAMASEIVDESATKEKYELYRHDQAKFIKTYITMTQPNGSDISCSLWYATVYDGMYVDIMMILFSDSRGIGPHEESILQSIVSTVHFDHEPFTSPDTEAFLYREENTGIEFTVPANWTQKPPSQDQEIIGAAFTSSKEPGLDIIFSSFDIWNSIPPSEKVGFSRSDIDNFRFFSFSEFVETMGIEESEVSTVSYDGKEYYKYPNTVSVSTYGVDYEITLTGLLSIENGYVYMFQFSGDSTSPYYEDFEALLKSVKYPTAESAAPSNGEDTVDLPSPSTYEDTADLPSPSTYEDTADRTPPSSYADTPKRADPPDLYSEYSPTNLLFSILVTITIYSVPIFIYRYAIVKQPVGKRRAKLITIVYGVIAFVVMCFLSIAINGSGASVGGSIVLWSMVNYKVLTGGKDRQVEEWSEGVSRTAPPVGDWQGLTPEADRISAPDLPEAARDSETDPGKENVVFCHQCGAKLNRDHHFCYKCGAEIIK